MLKEIAFSTSLGHVDPNWKNARDYLIIAAQYRIFRIVDWLVAQRGIDPRSLSEDELYSVYQSDIYLLTITVLILIIS